MKEIIEIYKRKRKLKNKLKEAIAFFKKTPVSKLNKKCTLYTLPWYVMLGPKNTGKTTLLANSELRYILEKKINSHKNNKNTNNHEWWATKNAIIVDTPGKNFDAPISNKSNLQKFFLRLIKKYNHEESPAGVILVLDLYDLIHKPKSLKKIMFKRIREQITTLAKTFHTHFPIYLILNKCDMITGFREFFHDLSREERQQIWGGFLQIKKTIAGNTADNFNDTFNKLLKRLNDQLTWRLQHENNTDKKVLINEFPLQMLKLQKVLNQLLTHSFRKLEKNCMPQGIFFTSATQTPNIGYRNKNAFSSTNHSLINIQQPKNKAYFAHDLFNNIIFADKSDSLDKKHLSTFKYWNRIIICLFSGALICASFYFCNSNYYKQLAIINRAQQTMTANRFSPSEVQSTKPNFTKQMEFLNSLQQANFLLKSNSNTIFSLVTNKFGSNINKNITKIYQKKVNEIILPKIVLILKNKLQDNSTTPTSLYKILQCYLMLGDSSKYDASYLKIALPQLLTAHTQSKLSTKLLSHVDTLLDNYVPSIKLNQHIILKAQKKLKSEDPINLAFVIMKNNLPNNQLLSLNLNANMQAASVLTYADDNATIPSIYTANSFTKIYPDLINKAARDVIYGNWVIGKTHFHADLNTEQLTQQLTEKYLTNYANVWLKFLTDIKIVNFTKIDKIIDATKLLSEKESPIIELIDLARANIVPQVADIDKTLKEFVSINTDLTKPLKELYNYLAEISNADNPEKMAFAMSGIRMRNNGANDPIENLFSAIQAYPEPIKSWLYNITSNAWHLMLVSSENYINSQWQKNIVPQYQAQIAEHFPFLPSTTKNVSIDNFSYFFAPNGLIDNFYETYLAPFIIATQQTWHLKNIDADTLPIYHTTLDSFQRAYQIQRIYFKRTEHRPYLSFVIQPTSLDKEIASLTISLGNQEITYNNGDNYQAVEFVWPDNVNSNLAKITVTDKDNNQHILAKNGPWGWFKLLASNKIQPSSQNYYNVAFNIDSLTANVAMSNHQKDNPFSLNIFNNFSLPNSL